MRHNRIPSIDLLRSGAILAVVFFHCPFFVPGSRLGFIAGYGSLGVNLFFVLSGYLIAFPWFTELRDSGGHALFSRFILRRTLRIWPNYFAIIALFLLMPGIEGVELSPLWHYLFFVQNFFRDHGFGPSWSLCVEEHFYLLFPLISAFAYRRGARFTFGLFSALLLAGFILRFSAWTSFRPDQVTLISKVEGDALFYSHFYRPTYMNLDGLVLGVGIAAIRRFSSTRWEQLTSFRNGWLLAFALCIIAAIGISSQTVAHQLPDAFLASGAPADRGMLSTTFSVFLFNLSFAFLLLAALSPDSILNRVRIPFVQATALLSYAMYLTHMPSISWLMKTLPAFGLPRYGWVPLLLMLITIYLAAAILYWVIEKPFLKWRDHLGNILLPGQTKLSRKFP